MSTKIEYTDRTWNVVHGCSKISVGCRHCYAEKMANRLRGRSGYPEYEPFQPILRHDRLKEPFKWKKPQRVMVTSMGDLFHDEIPGIFITQVYEIMLANPQHTFLNLTKRAERMMDFTNRLRAMSSLCFDDHNIWHGVSVEDQYNAKRIVSLGETQVKHKILPVIYLLFGICCQIVQVFIL